MPGAGETQGSHLPPGTYMRDTPTSCPSSSPSLRGAGGGAGSGERSPSFLRPSPVALPLPPGPELNFGAVTLNSMDATSERDFVGESWQPARCRVCL